MLGGRREPDALDQWLRGEGLTTLDAITRGSPAILGVMDPNFIIRYLNWTVPGLDRANVVGGSVFDLVPPGNVDTARACFEYVFRTGVASSFEMMYPGVDGLIIWVVRVGPIIHESRVIGVFTVNIDVTEERRGGVDRDRFFSLSLDLLVVITPEGGLKRVNPAFGQTLGYETSELVGVPFLDFVVEDDRERTAAAWTQVLAGHVFTDFENRYRRRDGSLRVFSWRATVDPISGDTYAVARDITEQRAIEAQLRHVQKMDAIGQLAGGVAHDFNNLMQAVLANVELAEATLNVSPAVALHLKEIEHAGLRAAELTKQLLTFSRRQPLHRVPINLDKLMVGMQNLLRRLLPENIRIEMHGGTDLSPVSADRTQLEQVILNLCVNARDAMERGGALTLETAEATIDARECALQPWAKPGVFVKLSVTDTGAGMAADVRERVFEPFFTTKSDHHGTGLGLATVYGIVQQHGGLIHVESVLGVGTTFDVYLPVHDRPSANPETPSDNGKVPTRGRETILIAEDDAAVRGAVLQILENSGYQTLAAVDGQDAVRILRERSATIDLVILDVVMPALDGPEAWEHMRAIRPDMRALFLSGYADERCRERLPKGAQVLEKPVSARDLLRGIRRALDA